MIIHRVPRMYRYIMPIGFRLLAIVVLKYCTDDTDFLRQKGLPCRSVSDC